MNAPKSERNINIDIVKTIAIIGVVCIHFFNHLGMFGTNISKGNSVLFAAFCTQIFTFCVPLFLLATGYLIHKKTPTVAYYKKIIGVLFTYLTTSVFFQAYQFIIAGKSFSFGELLSSIINIEGSQYSWYVEMYIGLFLIAPFLNMIWSSLQTKKQKGLLCLLLILISSAPNIIIGEAHLPDYWLPLWPIMYYFIGAYLKEYNFKIILPKRIIWIILSFGWCCLSTFIMVLQHDGRIPGVSITWGFPWTLSYSVAIFSLILSLQNTNRIPNTLKSLIIKISTLTLSTYLISAIFDNFIYRYLLNTGSAPTSDLKWFPITVPIIFICSFICAIILDSIQRKILPQKSKTPHIKS